MTDDPDIKSHYQKFFYTVKATTPEQLKQAYHIRYEVYYDEYKWPEPQPDDNHLESDIWDRFSVHALLFHKPSNQPIGYIRVIPLETSVTHTLPLEEHYADALAFQNAPISHLRQGRAGEVSRMAILPSFRRRASDKNYSYETDSNNHIGGSEKRFPINYMPMSLTFTAIILLMQEQLDYGAALMEPRLARLLIRFGVDLKQIGEPMDYYGLRAPYLIFPETTYQNLSAGYKELFDMIKQELTNT
jgi:N-acyl amino acid synthase of PEP-CTERM/exosortase system